jgi:hypothetical protein
MVVDPELLEELEKAVGEEKGLHAAGMHAPPTDPDTMRTGLEPYARGCTCGAARG